MSNCEKPLEPNTSANDDNVLELRRGATGVWAVRSTSSTVYYLDMDRRLLLRARGPGSPRGPHDGQWVALVSVSTIDGERDAVRVGARHEFVTDPDGWTSDFQWWIPRACTAIVRLSHDDAARLADGS